MLVGEGNGSGAGDLLGNGSRGEAPPLPTFSAAALARVVLTLGLCGASAACNAAVLLAGAGGRRRGGGLLLLRHLAAADLLLALLVMPLDAAWIVTVQWRAGDAACRLLMFLKLLPMYASAFLTALISLERQAAVRAPLARRRRLALWLPAAWLLSAALSLPQLFLFHTVTVGSAAQNFTQCTTRGSFARRWHEAAYNLLTFGGLFLLPGLVMVSSYARILLALSGPRRAASSREPALRRSRNPLPRARRRLLRLSAAIVGSFLVCWTPYYSLGLWYWFWPAAMEGALPPGLAHLLFVFGLLNACLDPLLYGLCAAPLPRRGLRARPASSSLPGSGRSSVAGGCPTSAFGRQPSRRGPGARGPCAAGLAAAAAAPEAGLAPGPEGGRSAGPEDPGTGATGQLPPPGPGPEVSGRARGNGL